MAETETQLQTPAAAKSATTTPTKQPLSVLVTGCSEGGIGCALAEEFQRRGLRVFATARNTAKIPEALRTASGVEVLTIDVTDKESVRAAAAAVSTSTGGTLNLLVNNAGGGYQVPLLDADLDVGRRLFETNIWGTLSVTQTFSPLLLAAANENGGSGTARIVNIGSVVGYTMVPWEGICSCPLFPVSLSPLSFPPDAPSDALLCVPFGSPSFVSDLMITCPSGAAGQRHSGVTPPRLIMVICIYC